MMRIAVLCGAYPPAHSAHRSGGTLRAIVAMVSRLGGDFDFQIVTRHSPARGSPAPGVWHDVGRARVFYAREQDLSPLSLARILVEARADVYHFNSLFAPQLSVTGIALHRWAMIPRRPPDRARRCGESNNWGRLATKRLKKAPFLAVARLSGSYEEVLWHAGSEAEAADIRREFGCAARVLIARDLTTSDSSVRPPPGRAKPTREPRARGTSVGSRRRRIRLRASAPPARPWARRLRRPRPGGGAKLRGALPAHRASLAQERSGPVPG